MEIDPVCHMEVDPKDPQGGTADYHGKTYYFCSPGCRKRFNDDPEKFLKQEDRGS